MSDILEMLKRRQEESAAKKAGGQLGKHDDTAEKDERLAKSTPALETGLDTARLAHKRKAQHYTLNAAGIKAATKQIQELPGPGWSTHCIMGGAYHGFDIIPAIYRLAGEPITRLTIATLSFSKRNMANLCHMLDEKMILGVEMLASDYFAKKDSNIYGPAKVELEARGHRIGFTRNHAKVMCIEFPTAGHFTIETSANLRSCVNFEQFALHNDTALMQYHRGWITHLLDNQPAEEPEPEE